MFSNFIPSEESIEIASSFIPRTLRSKFSADSNYQPRSASNTGYGYGVWIDIKGFTTLSHRLLRKGDSAEKLTNILNKYHDYILRLIASSGGEPLFYAGDGIMAGWLNDTARNSPTLYKVIECACAIQNMISLVDEDGNKILIHIVVGSGEYALLEVGGYKNIWRHVFFGEILSDISKVVSSNSAPNDVILSANVHKLFGQEKNLIKGNNGAAIISSNFETKREFRLKNVKFDTVSSNYNVAFFTPKPIIGKLSAASVDWIAEIRNVSVVFIQLVDFQNEKNPTQFIQETINYIIPVVIDYDGFFNSVWVDEKAANVLIAFGPPTVAHTDDSIRAVKTADTISQKLNNKHISHGIGVAIGMAYCGLLGDNYLRQYTLIGDVVNVAARLSALANNKVNCNSSVYKDCVSKVNFSHPKNIYLKGKTEATKVWHVENIKDDISEIISVLSFERELKQIKHALAPKINIPVVFIDGGSGSGKTDLLNKLNESLKESRREVMLVRLSISERMMAFNVFQEILIQMLNLNETLPFEQQQETVRSAVQNNDLDKLSLFNVILPFNFKETATTKKLSGGQRSQETFNLLANLFSVKADMIVIIDDAQWLDDLSTALIKQILGHDNAPNIVMGFDEGITKIARENFKDFNSKTIEIKKLDKTEIKDVICLVLRSSIDGKLLNLVYEIADGNPYQCIEIVNTLVNKEFIQERNDRWEINKNVSLDLIELPKSIKAVISKNLDKLEAGPSLAVKSASVAGNKFDNNLIEDIFPVEEQKEQVVLFLDEGAKAGIFSKKKTNYQAKYSFKGNLTRQTAYDTLLFKQRRSLHRSCALWYQKRSEEGLQQQHSVIAHHWKRYGDLKMASDFLKLEAIRLFMAGFVNQSVTVGLEAIGLLYKQIPTEVDNINPKIEVVMEQIGEHMHNKVPNELLNHPELDNKEIEKVIEIILVIGPFAFQSGQIELFTLLSGTCLQLTLEHGHSPLAADVYSMYSPIYAGMTKDRAGAYAWSKLALDLDEKMDNTIFSRVAFVHGWFHNHWYNKLKDNIRLSGEATKHGFQSGDYLFAFFNMSSHVMYKAVHGYHLNDIIEECREGLKQNNNVVMNAAFHLRHEMQFAKALAGMTENTLQFTDEEYQEPIHIASICETELGNQIGYYLVSKVKIHTWFNDYKGALAWAEKAINLLSAIGGQVAEFEYFFFRTIACLMIKLKSGNLSSTHKEWIREGRGYFSKCAQDFAPNFEHKHLIIEALAIIAENHEKAEELFNLAIIKAKKEGFLQDIALAYELQARTQHLNSQTSKVFYKAMEAYKHWGAKAKVKALKKLVD